MAADPGKPSDANCGNTISCAWQEAIDYCMNLELTGKRNKKKQWRLPEVKELISLVDYRVEPNGPLLTQNNSFTDVPVALFWSATSVAGTPEKAWFVDFISGPVLELEKFGLFGFAHVWCVSSGQDAH